MSGKNSLVQVVRSSERNSPVPALWQTGVNNPLTRCPLRAELSSLILPPGCLAECVLCPGGHGVILLSNPAFDAQVSSFVRGQCVNNSWGENPAWEPVNFLQ
jgi:hypothetical protein